MPLYYWWINHLVWMHRVLIGVNSTHHMEISSQCVCRGGGGGGVIWNSNFFFNIFCVFETSRDHDQIQTGFLSKDSYEFMSVVSRLSFMSHNGNYQCVPKVVTFYSFKSGSNWVIQAYFAWKAPLCWQEIPHNLQVSYYSNLLTPSKG